MRGHEPILAMRQKGRKPSIVFVNDYPCDTDWTANGDHATVSVVGDRLASLDLRFLVGLRVSISGTDERRVKGLFEAAKQAGSAVVGASVTDPAKRPWQQDGWCEVWRG